MDMTYTTKVYSHCIESMDRDKHTIEGWGGSGGREGEEKDLVDSLAHRSPDCDEDKAANDAGEFCNTSNQHDEINYTKSASYRMEKGCTFAHKWISVSVCHDRSE